MANKGRQGEKLFIERLSAQNYTIQDVSGNSEYWEKDIDIIATSANTGLTKSFEIKWDSRINSTGNMYLELTNVNSKGGLGWLQFCQADYLAYGDALARVFYIFPLAELKERVQRIKPRVARCGNDSTGYLMPIDSVIDICKMI